MNEDNTRVFSNAIIQTKDIGQGTKIWNFTHIREGAQIGTDCTIGNNCYIDKCVIIGHGVKIQNGSNIYLGVELCDDVFIGPNVTFTNVKRPRSQHPVDEMQYLETLVCTGATIGAGSVVICGNGIGEYAFVGAGSLVTHPVLPYNLVIGSPARAEGVVCSCGYKIHGLPTQLTSRTCGCGNRYSITPQAYQAEVGILVKRTDPISFSEKL